MSKKKSIPDNQNNQQTAVLQERERKKKNQIQLEKIEKAPLTTPPEKTKSPLIDEKTKAQSLFLIQFRLPDPQLDWEAHQDKNLISEFSELIENRFNEVKRSSSIYKYYAKIGFQAFIYLLNMLELLFTLIYGSYNEFEDDKEYEFCYLLSIILCILLHCGAWMYTFKFREVAKQNFFIEMIYYIYYMIMGGLSYLKIAPFIYYYNRNESIRQFSFSEINKYLILSGEDKFRNPCMLFKQRTKHVNIFRDLIFHRVALLSMMITMTIQTIPQLFIQGFYNTYKESWDGFNVVSFLLLISNLIYYFLELQFIVFTTTYRQMQTELQFKLKKIKLYFIQETKQLLKSDLQYMGFVESFYFHIDPSTFSNYQKKRCMVQIIKNLIKQKKCKNIEFHFIDLYEKVTLQYLANCFKLMKVQKISLLYHNKNSLPFLESTFKDIPNLTFKLQNNQNLCTLWDEDIIDPNAEAEKVKVIQFIENPKINTGYQAVQQNQFRRNDYIQLSAEFEALIPANLREVSRLIINQQQIIDQNPQEPQEIPQQIIDEAKLEIQNITKQALFGQSVFGIRFLVDLYGYYETWTQLNSYQGTIQTIWSLMNGSLQIVSLTYLSNEIDMFIAALIVLTTINPILQMASFAIFQNRVFKDFTPLRQLSQVLLFAIFNFLKIWDIIMICLYLGVEKFAEVVGRDFSSVGYIKFKSYASKFQGSIATTVFQFTEVKIDPKNILQIKEQPFYVAGMWRINVEEALNKIPQFFIYILSLSSNEFTATWLFSFFQQIKDSLLAIKNILEVVIKDFFIPALILSTVSVDQFFQSMLYLSSISNQILLEYPKSFQIVSKVQEQYLKEKFTFKINLKTLNFNNYGDLKKKKMLAQFRYVLAQITTILEIDEAQRLFCMGSELNDLIRCLRVSPMKQLKLNFYLDEIDPQHFHYINAFIRNSPKKLQFLQLQIESINVQQMQVCVERKDNLKAFSYSYFQKIPQYRDRAIVPQQQNLKIDQDFLKLDRFDFEQFYFEVSGNLILNNCHKLLEQFTQLKIFKASIFNNNATNQTFQFSSNLKSRKLEILDITCENIILEFQQYSFTDLKILKMILKKCKFNKEKLKEILLSLNTTTVVYIDMSQSPQHFTAIEQKDIVRKLETLNIDVFIKI